MTKRNEIMRGDKKLDEAISRLASLYEYGALMASANPVALLNEVYAEIVACRELDDDLNEVKNARMYIKKRAMRIAEKLEQRESGDDE